MTASRLNLWDRLFNRFSKKVHKRGTSSCRRWWMNSRTGEMKYGEPFEQEWIEYEVTDRVTGSVTIEREELT